MKLLYIIKSVAQLGGLDRVWVERMNHLAENCQHKVFLLTYEQGAHPLSYPLSPLVEHRDMGVRFLTLYNRPVHKRVFAYIGMRATFRKRLRQQVKEIAPDVVICSTDAFPLMNIIMDVAEGCHRVIESHVAKNDFLKGSRFANSALLHTLFTWFDNYIIRQIRRCDRFIVLTRNDHDEWCNLIPWVEVIPNPVSRIPEKVSTLEEKKVISVGRLTYQKGFDMLVCVWDIVCRKHPDWTLSIYGNGSELDGLKRLIADRKVDNIFIHPATPDIYDKYLESSIYVMSSRYEGFGLVLVEAMSCGLPCISFDCPHGPAEIIVHNENGMLTDNGNVDEMAADICFLIEHDEERRRMGANARVSTGRYKKSDVMKRWEVLFDNLKASE